MPKHCRNLQKLGMPMMLVCMYGLFILGYHSLIKKDTIQKIIILNVQNL